MNIIAIDLGATSGRVILAECSSERIVATKELARFPNSIVRACGRQCWDIWELYSHILEGLKAAADTGLEIESIGIDTWGVDFVCVGKDGSLLGLPRSYRDPYTEGVPEQLFEEMPREKVYGRTGIQIMNFNTIFQLYAQHKAGDSALEAADKILFLPDAISYLLTGKMVCEYTILSTSQLMGTDGDLDDEILALCGVGREKFHEIVLPGHLVGTITPEVQKITGLGNVKVVAVAGHDTGSAVAAVPAEDEAFAYLSSGTWSLMGVELPKPMVNASTFRMNFTNEGGIDGTTRFLKNITGMWIMEQCKKVWAAQGRVYGHKDIENMVGSPLSFASLIDPDDPSFANPEDMTEAIRAYCRAHGEKVPETDAEMVECVLCSLALKCRLTLDKLRTMVSIPVRTLHIIGGGSQNVLLSKMTANAVGIKVVAGPGEATAMGNMSVQLRAAGLVGDRWEMRRLVSRSCDTVTYLPEDGQIWSEAYDKFLKVIK